MPFCLMQCFNNECIGILLNIQSPRPKFQNNEGGKLSQCCELGTCALGWWCKRHSFKTMQTTWQSRRCSKFWTLSWPTPLFCGEERTHPRIKRCLRSGSTWGRTKLRIQALTPSPTLPDTASTGPVPPSPAHGLAISFSGIADRPWHLSVPSLLPDTAMPSFPGCF